MKCPTPQSRQNAPGRIDPLRILLEAAKGAFASLCKALTAIVGGRQTLILTNHGQASGVILANAFPFRIVQDNWIMIPFGDFKNVGPMKNGRAVYPNGVIQRVDKQAADAMVNEFNSVIAKVGRALFGGRPWQIGHPDQDPTIYTDQKAYGWIMNARTGEDGLYIEVNWTPDGEKLKTDGSFKYYSPAWTAPLDSVLMENGVPVVRPTKLLSCGFTNNPNIPVIPLANDGRQPDLLEVLSDMSAEDFEALCERVDQLKVANAGTSDGAKKGWATRRGNSAGLQKAAATVAAKKIAERKGPSAAEKAQGVRVKGGKLKWDGKVKSGGIAERASGNRPVEGEGQGHSYSIQKQGGLYSLHHSNGGDVRSTKIAQSTRKADLYKHAEEHNTAWVKGKAAFEAHKQQFEATKTPPPLKITLPKSNGGEVLDGKISPKSQEMLDRFKAANTPEKMALRSAAVAGATKKPGGLFSKLLDAFKNPHAHSGDAFGNAQ